MYIKISGQCHYCGMPSFGEHSLIWPGVTGLETPITGTVTTYRDDGFQMRKDKVSEWLRVIYENETLTLTNIPEPDQSMQMLSVPQMSDIEILTLAVAELAEQMNISLSSLSDPVREKFEARVDSARTLESAVIEAQEAQEERSRSFETAEPKDGRIENGTN